MDATISAPVATGARLDTDSTAPRSGGVPFSFFVDLVYRISCIPPRPANAPSRAPAGTYPALRLFETWLRELHARHAPLPAGTLGVVLRLLFSEEDARRAYGMQEPTLARLLARALGLSTEPGHRGSMLSGWKTVDGGGCLGDVVCRVVGGEEFASTERDDDADEDTLTLSAVDALLTELAAHSAYSDASVRASRSTLAIPTRPRDAVLRALISGRTPRAAAVIAQLVLKDLRPLLYPAARGTRALVQFRANAVRPLARADALRACDPAGRMLGAYRVRGALEAAATFVEEEEGWARVGVGAGVQIPKCEKGRGCALALARLARARTVWAETKYDGERAQVHVCVLPGGAPQITIFSKSGRDSTLDRRAVHPIILDALGLSLGSSSGSDRPPVQDIIVEAEMVAYSDVHDRVDEFWRIRSLIESTAKGGRARRARPPRKNPDADHKLCACGHHILSLFPSLIIPCSSSQSSLISDAAGDGERHLALVFFDILFLNGTSLLSTPYGDRRALLERVITPEHGHAMLAQRQAIAMKGPRGLHGARDRLREVMAAHLADFEEGIVLKAEESRYCDWQLPWVKLKRDYIPGYGDCLDLAVVGASWEKDRGRDLRVGPDAFTTFYLGVLANAEAVRGDPNVSPHFQVYFSVSYLPSREEVEEATLRFKATDLSEYDARTKMYPGLPYKVTLFPGIPPPSIMLHVPLLGEVYGGGFTKADNCTFYELRWPRMTKLHRRAERDWRNGASIEELQRIAHESIGRDPSNKEVTDWVSDLWGKAVKEGVRSPENRRQLYKEWLAKLAVSDGIEAQASSHGSQDRESTAAAPSRIQALGKESDAVRPTLAAKRLVSLTNVTQSPASAAVPAPDPRSPKQIHSPRTAPRKRRLNVDENDVPNPPPIPSPARAKTRVGTPRSPCLYPSPPPKRLKLAQPLAPSKQTRRIGFSPDTDSPLLPDVPNSRNSRSSSARGHIPPSQCSADSPLPTPPASSPAQAGAPRQSDSYTPTKPTNPPLPVVIDLTDSLPPPRPFRKKPHLSCLSDLLAESLVWIGRPPRSTRPWWRRPSSDIVPDHRVIGSLEALLLGCGWTRGAAPGSLAPRNGAQRGVLLLDDKTEEGRAYKERAVQLLEGARSGGGRPRKEVWGIDMEVLKHGELEMSKGDYERFVLFREK
ncbi:hypothetical protein BC834DRAFT_356527 [Gloeopeniophorella convolvens]|nr:hypothetical protein BC834DRAFT_356527 [Gloeopeniophorella convolvens]